MGRKAGKYKKKEGSGRLKKNSIQFDPNDGMLDDEIDAFHKKRDVVPLNINDDMEESDEDAEQPVLDFEDDDEDEDEEEDENEDTDDDKPSKGLDAKIMRTQKFLRAKFPEDETLDDADEEEPRGRIGDIYKYGADVNNESDNDEDAADEEREAVKQQAKIAEGLSMEDYGLESTGLEETDREPTFEEILDHGKPQSKASVRKEIKDEEGLTYEIVKKDLSALTKEEQMDVVLSSAPELIGLLSELKDALEELQTKVNPLVEKFKGQESSKKGALHYFEVKQLLLQSFCQAITFYLLLKSEGQPVLDHPVLLRLIEIKNLLDKTKEMDDKLSFDVEEMLKKELNNSAAIKLSEEVAPIESDSLNNGRIHPVVASAEQETIKNKKESGLKLMKSPKAKESRNKHQDKPVIPQSMEMLKIRASLEEKLKKQGVYSSIAPKVAGSSKNQQSVNRQLETFDDFVDEAMKIDAVENGRSNGASQHLIHRPNKRKVIAGDDDIPKRDDIGERRRKHELRVLAGAGIRSGDDFEEETGHLSSDGAADANEDSGADSDLEFYKQVEQKHAARLAQKSAKYSRTQEAPSLPETVDGKRHISNQIATNRGLTRSRNKQVKNPRKKYKLKHQKAEIRRKGQVRDMKKQEGSYAGEKSGINAGISRSIRF